MLFAIPLLPQSDYQPLTWHIGIGFVFVAFGMNIMALEHRFSAARGTNF
jgi:hypothetical protein